MARGDFKRLIEDHFRAERGPASKTSRPTPATAPTASLPQVPAQPSSGVASQFVIIHSQQGPTPLPHSPPDAACPVARARPADLPTVPRRKTREWHRHVVELLAQVAEAVHYMHVCGVCHRDLKPSNILVGDDNNPKVTDFGLASLVAAGRTSDDEVAGTPNYMPPEQAEQMIGPQPATAGNAPSQPTAVAASRREGEFYQRGDIYSLGAVLYEMLTGRPPFEGSSPTKILEAVVSQPLKPPRQVNPRVPRRLEAICLKCLARDPGQRYPSSAALAEDLHQYLKPWPLILFGLLGVVVLLIGWMGWSAYTGHQERLARIDRLDGEAHAHEAQAAQEKGQAAVQQLLQAREARVQLLRELGTGHAPDLEVPRLTLEIGKGYFLLRDLPAAKREFREVRQRLEKPAYRSLNKEKWQPLVASAYHWEGAVLQDEKEHQGSLDCFNRSRELWEELFRAHPDSTVYKRYLGRSHGYIGDIELELGDQAAADRAYNEALRLRKELADLPGAAPEDKYQYARSLGNTGNYHAWIGNFAEAIKAYEERAANHARLKVEKVPQDKVFQVDRPDTLITIVELRLLTRSDVDQKQLFGLLARAEEDKDADKTLELRILVACGMFFTLTDHADQAGEPLRQAVRGYRELIRKGLAQAEDFYNLAQAHALLSRLTADSNPRQSGYHEVAAVICLDESAERGYWHLKKLEIDPAFDQRVRARSDFHEALDKMKRLRSPAR
jgi:tetratricopeptide (TPR) repeat protein